MRSLNDFLGGRLIPAELIETFKFIEGEFTFDELRNLLGRKAFSAFLLEYLQENNVKLQTVLKDGLETLSPLKTSRGEIIKIWLTKDGQPADARKWQPEELL